MFKRLINWFRDRRALRLLSNPRMRQYFAYARWLEDHSKKVTAKKECGDLPIIGWHPERWTSGSRTDQYRQINEIVEAIGAPMKRQLEAQGFQEDFMRAKLSFALKQTLDGEIFEIEAGTAAIDYDPVEGRQKAEAYNVGARGSDRLLYWDYVYTVDGRVQGHFDADEDRRFSDVWKAKHGVDAPKSDWLYLHALTVEIIGFPAEPIYGGRRGRY